MHPTKLLMPALLFVGALVMGALALQRDSAVPLQLLLPAAARSVKRDYVYPELSCPQAPQPVPLPNDWKALIGHHFEDLRALLLKYYVRTNSTLGMAVAVVYDQQVLWSDGIGAVDQTTRRPVSPNNLFRIGSISKVFPDLMLLQLRDRGLLDLDDEIVKHFPEWKDTIKNVFPTKRSITWRQLGSHMSGLPRSSPCDSLWGNCNITTAQVFERIKTQKTIQPIETRPSYSNFGFALLGRLLEKLVGQSYESYVENNILKPLNMHNTGFTFTPEVRSKMAVGYYDDTDIPAPLFDLGWEAPAGQMYSSVDDLCQLMKLIFRDNYTEGAIPSQILDGQTLREWLIPLYDSAATKSGVSSMGMPWENELMLLPGYPNYWQKGKSGGVFGYTAHMLMIPELKLGVAVLMNGGLLGPAGEAAYASLALLTPVFDKLLGQLQPAPSLPPNYQKLVGTYLLRNDSTLPPILYDISATVRVITDANNVQRLRFTLTASHADALSSYLEYHDAFNLDNNGPNGPTQVILQAAVDADPSLCSEVLGGNNQLVYFGMEPNNGNAATLELSGLFWGLTMYRTKS